MEFYMRAPGGKAKVLTFSYDDGSDQDLKLARILNERKLKATFNVNSRGLTRDGCTVDRGTMTHSQCASLSRDHEIAVHCLTHPSLDHLSAEQIVYETVMDRIHLEKLTGKIVRGMAYPFGAYNGTVTDVLKSCGIAYSRTVRATHDFGLPRDWLVLDPTCHHNDPKLMSLAERFLQMGTDGCQMQMFYIWGHSYEFELDRNWDRIEQLADRLAERSDIWYATNIEIYDYVHAFHELRFDVEQTQCYNPTATKLWFAVKKDVYCVEPGKTLKLI